MNQTGISSYTEPRLVELVKEMGQPAFRAKQLFKWLHEKQARAFCEMTDQPKGFLAALEERFFIETLETERRQQSKDGTVSFGFIWAPPIEDLKRELAENARTGKAVVRQNPVGRNMNGPA